MLVYTAVANRFFHGVLQGVYTQPALAYSGSGGQSRRPPPPPLPDLEVPLASHGGVKGDEEG